MMIMTPRWRDEFKVEDAMKETCPGVFNGFGHVYGHHKEARPVVCATFPPFVGYRVRLCMQLQYIRWQ
jgi:hypothetical protein